MKESRLRTFAILGPFMRGARRGIQCQKKAYSAYVVNRLLGKSKPHRPAEMDGTEIEHDALNPKSRTGRCSASDQTLLRDVCLSSIDSHHHATGIPVRGRIGGCEKGEERDAATCHARQERRQDGGPPLEKASSDNRCICSPATPASLLTTRFALLRRRRPCTNTPWSDQWPTKRRHRPCLPHPPVPGRGVPGVAADHPRL